MKFLMAPITLLFMLGCKPSQFSKSSTPKEPEPSPLPTNSLLPEKSLGDIAPTPDPQKGFSPSSSSKQPLKDRLSQMYTDEFKIDLKTIYKKVDVALIVDPDIPPAQAKQVVNHANVFLGNCNEIDEKAQRISPAKMAQSVVQVLTLGGGLISYQNSENGAFVTDHFSPEAGFEISSKPVRGSEGLARIVELLQGSFGQKLAFRKDASKYFVVVTDKDAGSNGTDLNGDGFIKIYRDHFASQEVHISSIVPQSSTFTCGVKSEAKEYQKISGFPETRGLSLDLCENDYSTLFQRLTADIEQISSRDKYYLSANPSDRASLKVMVNGVLRTDFVYNPKDQSITLAQKPDKEGKIQVTYIVVGD